MGETTVSLSCRSIPGVVPASGAVAGGKIGTTVAININDVTNMPTVILSWGSAGARSVLNSSYRCSDSGKSNDFLAD